MAPLQIPGGAQLRVIFTTPLGGIMVNVLGARVSGALFGQALANTLDAAIKSAFASSGMGAIVHPGVSLAAVGVKDLRTASQTEFLGTGAAVPGTGTGDALPRSVAYVVTLRTNQAGPRYRGRVYLGGFTEAVNDPDATASSGVAVAATGFVQAISAAMDSNGLKLGVISRPAEPYTVTKVTEKNDGTTETITTSHEGRPGQMTDVLLIQGRNDTWDSQRRRTSAGGGSTLFLPMVSVDLADGKMSRTGKAAAGTPGRGK